MHRDERAHARQREARNRYILRPRFEDYAQKYADHFIMTRDNGVLEVAMHSHGGPIVLDLKIHNDWAQLWYDIGNDPENEVLIFSGTGASWMAFGEESMGDEKACDLPSDSFYDHQIVDSLKVLESLIFNVDIPTISCINGPGIHSEIALLFDITLCAEHATLFDPHFQVGLVPGDGQGLVFQHLMGSKRAGYYMYTCEQIDAVKALDFGLVNEVLPLDSLLPRAREIAATIMKQPRTTRRMTASVIRRPWKQLLVRDLGYHVSHEMLAMRLDGSV
ncbi:MAG: enoyl-CoA hydratase/isomerase family protein [Sphingomonadales bacterium]|nr:MAG: enoyl-CoA hydratase/isomerase family protein [Sphingomonadales bacterium]